MVKIKDTKNNDNNGKNKSKVSFSSIDADNIDDFQSANMIHKLKKIKKNKIKKNYNKIEGFNTLGNEHAPETETKNDNEPENNTIYSRIFDNIKTLFGKKDNYFENFKDNEYEGHDNIKEPESKTDKIRMKIIRAINNIYAKVNSINTNIASGIVKGISQSSSLNAVTDNMTNDIINAVDDITNKANKIIEDIHNNTNEITDDVINSVNEISQQTATIIENLKDIEITPDLINAVNNISQQTNNVIDVIKKKSDIIYKDVENTGNIESNPDNAPDTKQQVDNIYQPKKTIVDDITLVRNSIVLLETAAVSLWVVYNWYFLMYYAPDNDIHIPNFSRLELLKQANKSSSYSAVPGLKKMILYFFEFAIWFPEKLDGFLLNNENMFSFSGLTKQFLNGNCKFLLIYIISFYCIKHFAISFKNFFLDLLTNVGGNSLINLMFAIVLILFFVSAFTFTFVGDMEADTKIIFSFASSMLNPVGTFITWLIRFFITITISVPMGAVICGLYLIIYSLFGRFIYGGYNIKDIDQHIKDNIAGFENNDTCNTGGYMNLIYDMLKILFKFMDFLKNNVINIVYFLIFVYTTISMFTSLSNEMQNKEILIFLVVCITISLGINIWINLRKYFENTDNFDNLNNLNEHHGFDKNPNITKNTNAKQNENNTT